VKLVPLVISPGLVNGEIAPEAVAENSDFGDSAETGGDGLTASDEEIS
jgi:hypothetical protein